MKALALLALLFCPMLAAAQPAVDACRAFAKQQASVDGMSVEDVVLERDDSLALERYGRKVGNQPVGLVLSGNGAVVLPGAPSAELSFICLLADAKRALFFAWLPRENSSALAQCRRSKVLQPQLDACLNLLLRTAEMDLTQVYATSFQEANARGEPAVAAYRKANEEWLQYRDAECARRSLQPPAGMPAGEVELACRVELTRRRALDMRWPG